MRRWRDRGAILQASSGRALLLSVRLRLLLGLMRPQSLQVQAAGQCVGASCPPLPLRICLGQRTPEGCLPPQSPRLLLLAAAPSRSEDPAGPAVLGGPSLSPGGRGASFWLSLAAAVSGKLSWPLTLQDGDIAAGQSSGEAGPVFLSAPRAIPQLILKGLAFTAFSPRRLEVNAL